MSSPSRVPDSSREHRRRILAQHPIGELAEGRGRRDSGGPKVGRARDADPGRHETRFELRESRRLEPALAPKLFDQGPHRIDPGGLHLDLDTGQPEPAPFVANRDDGVVQRELGNRLAVDREIERASTRPDLEHLLERARSCECLDAPPDLAATVQPGQARRRQGLCHLEAAAQPFRRSREILEGRLDATDAPP